MSNLAYEQLNNHLKSLENFKNTSRPGKGWIRAIRDGLGMSRRQLAERLGLSTSRVQRLEQDEVTGSVTLKSLQRTAEAMDCVLVYAVLPRSSLDETLQQQAIKKAKTQFQAVSHSMALESQAVNEEANRYMVESLAKQMIEKSKRSLWDE